MKQTSIPSGLIEQTGTTYKMDREGVVTIKVPYETKNEDYVRLLPPVGAQHPRYGFATLEDVEAIEDFGGITKVVITYKGTDPNEDPTRKAAPVRRILANTREEPLETHQRYKDVTLNELATIRDVLEGRKKPSEAGLTGMAQELLEKRLRGQESYLNRATVVRQSTTDNSGVTSINNVGTIDTPPGAPANGSGNWLLTSVEDEQQGDSHKVDKEWMASGDEGFDPDIYG